MQRGWISQVVQGSRSQRKAKREAAATSRRGGAVGLRAAVGRAAVGCGAVTGCHCRCRRCVLEQPRQLVLFLGPLARRALLLLHLFQQLGAVLLERLRQPVVGARQPVTSRRFNSSAAGRDSQPNRQKGQRTWTKRSYSPLRDSLAQPLTSAGERERRWLQAGGQKHHAGRFSRVVETQLHVAPVAGARARKIKTMASPGGSPQHVGQGHRRHKVLGHRHRLLQVQHAVPPVALRAGAGGAGPRAGGWSGAINGSRWHACRQGVGGQPAAHVFRGPSQLPPLRSPAQTPAPPPPG